MENNHIQDPQTQTQQVEKAPKHNIYIYLLLAATIILFGFVTYLLYQNSILSSEIKQLQQQISNETDFLIENNDTLKEIIEDTNDIVSDNNSTNFITLDNPPLKITYSNDYLVEKSQEKNRRGSYVSYNFNKKEGHSLPSLYEIQFFSEESIKSFTSNCGEENFCFDGDFPTLERYFRQKQAFQSNQDYIENLEGGHTKQFELKNINNRNFFVTYNYSPNGSIYEYTTFVNDVKIDIWIYTEDESQETLSENLLKSLSIENL